MNENTTEQMNNACKQNNCEYEYYDANMICLNCKKPHNMTTAETKARLKEISEERKTTKANLVAKYRAEPLIEEHTAIVPTQKRKIVAKALRQTLPANRVIVADSGFVFKVKQRQVDAFNTEYTFFSRPRKERFKQRYCLSCNRAICMRNLQVGDNNCEQCYIFERTD